MVKKPVIVISGQPGCGSTTTGKLLSDKIGIEFFSIGTYFKKLAGEKTKKKVEWKSPTVVSTDYLSTKEGSDKKLHNDIDAMQVKLAKKGNIVIESKLGIHMLKDLADFKIWLKADIGTRAIRYAKREQMSVADAKKLLVEKGHLEKTSFKRIYGFDLFELEKKADMIIDTSNKNPEKIVEIIVSSLKKKKLI